MTGYLSPDVITIVGSLDLLQLPDAGDVGEPHLDVRLGENSQHRGERIPFGPENSPAGQRVTVVN